MAPRKSPTRSNPGPDQPRFVHDLLAFLTGTEPWPDWRDWWGRNRVAIEMHLDHRDADRLRRDPDHAEEILCKRRIGLETAGEWISYWTQRDGCPSCGEKVFVALPGATTQDEIREFARRCKFADDQPLPGRWDPIEKAGWIHPGRYCPNGCYSVMWNFGP